MYPVYIVRLPAPIRALSLLSLATLCSEPIEGYMSQIYLSAITSCHYDKFIFLAEKSSFRVLE